MGAEELNLGMLDEKKEGNEVSEKDKQKVQEDSKKAKQIKKQIKSAQIKGQEIALFLSKVLLRYYDNGEVIKKIHNFLENIEKEYENLLVIFTPFLTKDFNYTKINEYVGYIKKNMSKLTNEHIDLILTLIETEKLGGDLFWEKLKTKNSEINYEEFIKTLKEDLKNN